MVEILHYGPWTVVTGASSGIGMAFARYLAAAGLNLVLAARSTDRLENLGAALARAHGVEFQVVTVDLSRPESAAALVEATVDLDIGLLVSNAGGGRPGLLLDQSLDEALHYELAPAGIDVMTLLPGNVDTPIIDAFGVDRSTMPIRPQPADTAVREGIAAFLSGRPTHIPGRLMRAMTRLLPRTQSIRLNGRLLARAARALAERGATTGATPA